MKKSLSLSLLVLLFVINMSALATLSYNRWKKGRAPSPEPALEAPVAALSAPLELSPDQVERMTDLRLALENDVTALREQIYELRLQLMTATRRAEPDLTQIDRLIEEIGEKQSHLQKKVVRNMLKDGEVLTPRQRNRYFGMFEDHIRSWRPRRGQQRRGGRGPRWQRNY